MNMWLKFSMKFIISLVIYTLISLFIAHMQPAIGGSIAVSQLQDSYTSSIGVGFWKTIKNLSFLLLPIILLSVFANDIYRLFIKKQY